MSKYGLDDYLNIKYVYLHWKRGVKTEIDVIPLECVFDYI